MLQPNIKHNNQNATKPYNATRCKQMQDYILMPSKGIEPQSIIGFCPTIVKGYLYTIRTIHHSQVPKNKSKINFNVNKYKPKKCVKSFFKIGPNP
jgi:hypothetical protein